MEINKNEIKYTGDRNIRRWFLFLLFTVFYLSMYIYESFQGIFSNAKRQTAIFKIFLKLKKIAHITRTATIYYNIFITLA